MNVVFVTPEYITEDNYDGGLANYVHRTALSLKVMGCSPVVVTSSFEDQSIYHKGIRVEKVNVNSLVVRVINKLKLHRVAVPVGLIIQSFKLAKRLKAIKKKEKIDIVQYASYCAVGLFRLRNTPAVVRLSSIESVWRKARGQTETVVDKIVDKLEIIAINRSDGVYSPSVLIANKLMELIKINVHVIETPFFMETTNRDLKVYENLLQGKKYLLYFGTLSRLKGVDLIGDVVEEILDKYSNLYFVFIGKDHGNYNISMMEYVWAKAGKNKERVLYLSRLKHEQLYPIIEKAEGVVLPSRVDNFPNACLEAMANGQVVIGAKGASFEQIISDGCNGFLFEVNESKSLHNKIIDLLELEEHKKKVLKEGARNKSVELASKSKINELIDYYDSVVRRKYDAKGDVLQ